MSTFKILYFASSADYTACAEEELPAPLPATKLFPLLEQKYPGMGEKVLQSCLLTVNLEYVDLTVEEDGVMIQPGDEVASIPPVSSG